MESALGIQSELVSNKPLLMPASVFKSGLDCMTGGLDCKMGGGQSTDPCTGAISLETKAL